MMSTAKAKRHQGTLLVADDDDDYRLQLVLQLQREGFRVLEADSAQAAEALLQRETIDLAIVDVVMENWDSGFTLCYHIKQKNPRTPVIMVTAVSSETGIDIDAATDEERSWVKADVLFAKPVRFEQLLNQIEHFLHG